MDFPHYDTSVPERRTLTYSLNKLPLSPFMKSIRDDARKRGIPLSDDETIKFLQTELILKGAKNILEIGTAVGYSALCMLSVCPNAHITTIEIRHEFAFEAKDNFLKAGAEQNIALLLGDAIDILPNLKDKYDFIFLDGPKVQYIKYLPFLKEILLKGGVIFADDILFNGYVLEETPVPKKRKMLVEHIREYIDEVLKDNDFKTIVLDIGNGVALSVKK